jgi:hypothetical protein
MPGSGKLMIGENEGGDNAAMAKEDGIAEEDGRKR